MGSSPMCEGGRKESERLEKLPVSEYEQVTCWFRVGLLDLGSTGNLMKRYLPNGYFIGVTKCNLHSILCTSDIQPIILPKDDSEL